MILIRRLTAILTQALMIQFAILSGSGACPMADGAAAAEVAAVRMSPVATSGASGLHGASAAVTEMSRGRHESGQPNAPHHHDGDHTSSHCPQSCVPGACSSVQCVSGTMKERASLALELAGQVKIPAGFAGVPSWFARAPEPPPPRA